MQYTRRTDLKEVASKLRGGASWLLDRETENRDPLSYPYGLGFALFAAADLCGLVGSREELDLALLFDGGEDRGPNLYTRMRCIRDLCSAAFCAANEQGQKSGGIFDLEWTIHPAKTAMQIWLCIVTAHANDSDPNTVQEVTRLFDDVFESLLCVVECLSAAKQGEPRAWPEISRHIAHVREHFDYSEEALINSLRKHEG